MADQVLDARGLSCPLPVLRASKALRSLDAGRRLRILATDPAAPRDFAAFCETTGHVPISMDEEDEHFVIVIEKRAQ